jgi:hypothetical protein
VDNAKLSIPTPHLFPAILVSILDLESVSASETSFEVLTAAPPELPKSWHFIERTALPVRAPSFVS